MFQQHNRPPSSRIQHGFSLRNPNSNIQRNRSKSFLSKTKANLKLAKKTNLPAPLMKQHTRIRQGAGRTIFYTNSCTTKWIYGDQEQKRLERILV